MWYSVFVKDRLSLKTQLSIQEHLKDLHLSDAALPYMKTALQELAERTAKKLKQPTEEAFTGLTLEPDEDMG